MNQKIRLALVLLVPLAALTGCRSPREHVHDREVVHVVTAPPPVRVIEYDHHHYYRPAPRRVVVVERRVVPPPRVIETRVVRYRDARGVVHRHNHHYHRVR